MYAYFIVAMHQLRNQNNWHENRPNCQDKYTLAKYVALCAHPNRPRPNTSQRSNSMLTMLLLVFVFDVMAFHWSVSRTGWGRSGNIGNPQIVNPEVTTTQQIKHTLISNQTGQQQRRQWTKRRATHSHHINLAKQISLARFCLYC